MTLHSIAPLTWALLSSLLLGITGSINVASASPIHRYQFHGSFNCMSLLLSAAEVRNAKTPVVVDIPNYPIDIHLRSQPLEGIRDAVAVIFLDPSVHNGDVPRILLGKRGRGNGAGTWGIPGGKTDLVLGQTKIYESPFEAAQREVKQETGMILKKARMVNLEVSYEEDGSRFRVFVLLAEEYEGTPEIQDVKEVKEFIYQPVNQLGPEHLPEGLFKALPLKKFVKPKFLVPVE